MPAKLIFYFCLTAVCASSIALRAGPAAAQESAPALFEGLCAVCHGLGGKGDGPSAAGLHPKPANFTDCRAMAKDSDQVLFRIIKEGGQSLGRSTVMPSWKDSLGDGQIMTLVKLIRGFCKK
jgi:mono/diheme cytochrome c family protein